LLVDKEPEFIIYDDACRLRRYIENCYRLTPTPRLEHLIKKKYVVDKLHIQGHTETWCHQNCHPSLFRELDDINTIVCEQLNFPLGQYKYIIKHMNVEHYSFYLYIIMNELNKIKIDGKYEIYEKKILRCRQTLNTKTSDSTASE